MNENKSQKGEDKETIGKPTDISRAGSGRDNAEGGSNGKDGGNAGNGHDNASEPSDTTGDTPREKRGHPFLIIALAVAILFIASLMPWSKWTGGKISDFNLLSDVFPMLSTEDDTTETVNPATALDPELEKLAHETQAQTFDTIAEDTTVRIVVAEMPPRRDDGQLVIEDYTPDGSGLSHLKAALAKRTERPVRIGVTGDSYIEGDIFTQDVRSMLQQQYGGRGVGYVPAHSETAGFRRSVGHRSSGWTEHDIRKPGNHKFTISGQHFSGSAGSTFTFTASARTPETAGWSVSKVLLTSSRGGRVTLSNEHTAQTFDIAAAPDSVQCLTLPGETGKFTLTSSVPDLVVLGAWLEDADGVVLDNMSLRGDSGMTHRRVSKDRTAQMRRYVDYDLIVLEYGINALSEKQKDYTSYRKVMTQVARHLKECYPNADIVIMGIGDRGVKKNGQVISIPTAEAMVSAQRNAARDAGVLFWDTREAMGGEGAIINWRAEKLVNGDYIHLNAQGGKRLAEEFVQSLGAKLSE